MPKPSEEVKQGPVAGNFFSKIKGTMGKIGTGIKDGAIIAGKTVGNGTKKAAFFVADKAKAAALVVVKGGKAIGNSAPVQKTASVIKTGFTKAGSAIKGVRKL